MFENVLLEQEQKDLLLTFCEAARNVPRDKRREFHVIKTSPKPIVSHPGLANRISVYMGDIARLAAEELIDLSDVSSSLARFDVTPQGFAYYEWMKQRTGQPIQNIETTIRNYLDADHFQQKYPKAYQRWADAESMLWTGDSEHQLTTIGHLCREAIQEFATALVEHYQPPDVDRDKAHTVARIRAVLNLLNDQLGSVEKPFLDTLLAYWGTVSDLIQRQEHGGKKEGEPLVWEDGRRVVFQTAVVMFEIDRAISRAH